MAIKSKLEKYIDLIDIELQKVFIDRNKYNDKIYEAMDYSLFSGGKRLRPIMMIKTYEMYDLNLDRIMPFALAIEMIHTYSLIHDDLPSMDNDDTRRGKPTNHKLYGEAMAILAGDGLLNLSMETMTKSILDDIDKLDFGRYLRAINEIYTSSGCNGMIGGQVLDLLGTVDNMDKEKLMYMYSTKTAALFKASFAVGGLVGRASDEEVKLLSDFGLYLGLAYQIKDDILDIEKDMGINKLTYLSFHDLEQAHDAVKMLSDRAISQLVNFDQDKASFLVDIANHLIFRDI